MDLAFLSGWMDGWNFVLNEWMICNSVADKYMDSQYSGWMGE